ncbi:MAG TPA: thiamine phosphate synthase [Terriglobales bacterium]|nr:thiamine phosphate synthase [Terriglobales bacterium]
MLLYYITDRTQFPGSEAQRHRQLLVKVREAVAAGIDYIQLREKDLSGRQLEQLACEVVDAVRRSRSKTRLLINSRTDVALAIGGDGVNLRSQDISPLEVRRIWRAAGSAGEPVVAVSCHSEEEVRSANAAGADFALFGPVFRKAGTPGMGLTALRAACAHGIPVVALGGLTIENARSCFACGAAGVAGIRLFQNDDLEDSVRRLRL